MGQTLPGAKTGKMQKPNNCFQLVSGGVRGKDRHVSINMRLV